MFIYIYIFLPYVYILECICKILWTRLKKGNGRLGKLAMDTLHSSLIKKTAANSMTKEMMILDAHTTCMINCCQGKVAEIFF